MPEEPRLEWEGRGSALVGLLRLLDPATERHSYAAGAPVDEGGPVVVGELGGLRRLAGPGAIPLWLDDAGRATTDSYAPRPPTPAAAARLRWAAAPMGWRGEMAATARMRLSLARGRLLLQRAHRTGAPAVASSAVPAGYLHAQAGPGTLPLYSAMHPVTGDQILTTNVWEPGDLGYLEPTLLGHVVQAAPVTSRLGTGRPLLRWASRLGQRVRADTGPFEWAPGGGFDHVPPDSPVPMRLTGWALSPSAPVARVEISVDDRPAGRARLGVARQDVPAYCTHPAAVVSGFEFVLLRSSVPPAADRAVVTARVHDLHGATFELAPVEVSLAREDPRDVADTRVVRVRMRAREVVPSRARPVAAGGLNVLVFTHQLDLGGAQLYLLELLTRLVTRPGFAATVCAPSDGPLRDVLEDLGVPVHVTPDFPGADPHTYESRLAELSAWAAPQRFDAALVNTIVAFQGMHVAELLDIPAVVVVHESFELDQLFLEMHGPGVTHPHIRERLRHAIGDAAAAVFVADATRRQYLPHASDPSRFVTVPYGIELEAMREFRESVPRPVARRRIGIDESARLVLCLGTIEPRKSQAMLAQAFRAVANNHADTILALVGGLGDMHDDALRSYVDRAGLGSRVKVVPMSSDPYSWLAAADLLVCCSDVESLPRVIPEAMTFGVPVLATRIFGVPDIVEDGVTGYICEPRDLGDLAAALERVLALPESELAAVASRAAPAVAERHDPDASAERVGELLEGVVREAREGVERKRERADLVREPAGVTPAALGRAERIVVWIPSGDAGWELEEARPYYPRSIGGGLRTLYEIAAALAAAGRRVELRGVVAPAELDRICEAAGARPELPDRPRVPAASDTVIIPEGIDDPGVHARLALSPARVVLMLLGPPGLVGWPFTAGWSPPDPLTVDIDAVARPEHFRGAAELGYELWTHSPGLRRAAEAAGVACRLIGNGVPGGYPSPPPDRDLDVAWLSGNRWAPLAHPVVHRLNELGVECVALPASGHRDVLALFGRSRVVLHPLRVEGHSRIGCEARGMGAVPVVLSSNPFGVGLDEAAGALAVDAVSEMADAVVELLDAPDRLAQLSAAGIRSAAEQVEWAPFVRRVDAAFCDRAGHTARDARATIGRALREMDVAGLEPVPSWVRSVRSSDA